MKQLAYGILIFLLINSCNQMSNSTDKAGKQPADGKALYGMLGTDSIYQFTLVNRNGMKVKIINYGGTVTNILVPDREGKMGDVVLGYESLGGYIQKNNPYFGCLVGRYANRIAGAKFTLNGKDYTLAANNNGNSLHGGEKGFDKRVWTLVSYSDTSLTLAYLSNDGEEGYPGNLRVQVKYSLGEGNELKITYYAVTDLATPINLTNHCYFNLSAGTDSTVLDHELQLNADRYTPVNDQLIPTGKIESVKGTPMDFTQAKKIGTDLDKVPGGFDHNWVLNRKADGLEKIGSLYHAKSGRFMEIFTTQPGIQFYSGNFLDGTLGYTKAGAKYVKHGALCLETQHYPDSPNQPAFPGTILQPGVNFEQSTVYKFAIK